MIVISDNGVSYTGQPGAVYKAMDIGEGQKAWVQVG